jgi:hypothetical protein
VVVDSIFDRGVKRLSQLVVDGVEQSPFWVGLPVGDLLRFPVVDGSPDIAPYRLVDFSVGIGGAGRYSFGVNQIPIDLNEVSSAECAPDRFDRRSIEGWKAKCETDTFGFFRLVRPNHPGSKGPSPVLLTESLGSRGNDLLRGAKVPVKEMVVFAF